MKVIVAQMNYYILFRDWKPGL